MSGLLPEVDLVHYLGRYPHFLRAARILTLFFFLIFFMVSAPGASNKRKMEPESIIKKGDRLSVSDYECSHYVRYGAVQRGYTPETDEITGSDQNGVY